MALVNKSVLVPYAAQQMFDLVADIESYPAFLPWCGGAKILERTEHETVARIDIRYRGIRAHFTTSNRNQPPEAIVIVLRDGPFRKLDGTWRFKALAAAACKVEFCLEYEFATAILERIIGPVFGHIADSFIDAFVRRAESFYG